jgi:hypothetical protein
MSVIGWLAYLIDYYGVAAATIRQGTFFSTAKLPDDLPSRSQVAGNHHLKLADSVPLQEDLQPLLLVRRLGYARPRSYRSLIFWGGY